MARPRLAISWLIGLSAAGAVAGVLVLPTDTVAQDPEGWISVLVPREWSAEVTRGLVVRRKNSIRIEGLAFQPDGVDRVLIDGERASLQLQPNGEVRFVGYAATDSVSRQVEIVAYSSAARPPVVREYPYSPSLEQPYDRPEDAFLVGSGFQGERYAVVIGISDYADPAITPLRYADDDARSFYDFLTSEAAGLGGFKPENITFLTDEAADTRSVRTALTTFLRQATERDVVVIYLAGHGSADPTRLDDYYILTHDTDAANYPGTAISMDDVRQYVGQVRARDIILFTDACHSAAVSGGGLGVRAGDTNAINELFLERLQATAAARLTFTASEINQFSKEGAQWGGGHGVFTHQLLQGLRGRADEDGDGIITLGEMVEYTRFSVQRETNGAQVPDVSGSFDRSWPMAIADPDVVAEGAGGPAPTQRPVSGGGGGGLTTTRSVNLMNPGTTFAHSLVIPGSGQFRTGRGWRGSLVLIGSVAAVSYGFLSKTITKQCREATVGGECLSNQYTDIRTDRPDLVAGLAAAGALTIIGAVDALLGARQINRERLDARGGGGGGVVLLPTNRLSSSRPGDLRLLELRFR